jgi:segregation and condensation protein B
VSDGQVAASVERHLNAPRPVALSTAATQVLAIVAYRQPSARPASKSSAAPAATAPLARCSQRRLIALDEHRVFTTTPAFLEYLGLRDLADLPPLPELETEAGSPTNIVPSSL